MTTYTNLDSIKNRINNGQCSILTNWQSISPITEEAFIGMLDWLNEDPGHIRPDGSWTTSREAALKADGTWKKLKRVYDKLGSFVCFYDTEKRETWTGEAFEFPVPEENRANYGETFTSVEKIALNCGDFHQLRS